MGSNFFCFVFFNSMQGVGGGGGWYRGGGPYEKNGGPIFFKTLQEVMRGGIRRA